MKILILSIFLIFISLYAAERSDIPPHQHAYGPWYIEEANIYLPQHITRKCVICGIKQTPGGRYAETEKEREQDPEFWKLVEKEIASDLSSH